MHIQCEKNLLEEALQIASRAISARSPLPILSHILLEATDDCLKLTATDLDLGLQITAPAQVNQAGSLTCPAKLLSEIVSRFPGGPVTLVSEQEGRMAIQCGNSRFEVSTLPAEEFPSTPSGEDEPEFSLPQAGIKEMVRRVAIAAASSEESRAVMTGILTSLRGEELTMVATDGRRLAVMKSRLDSTVGRDAEAIIPARALQEMVRVLQADGDKISIRLSEGQVFFSVGNVELHCRLLEGNFPDYKKVLPTEFQRSCRVGREAFQAALRRMLIMAQEKQSPHLVRLHFHQDTLSLTANTPDLGSGQEDLPVVFEGDDLLIAFNGKYIVEALGVLECEEIQFELQEETRSAVIRPQQADGYHYVVMPVRLREPAAESREPVSAGA